MQTAEPRGTIVEIRRRQQRGTIQGDDGRIHHFDREGMIRWLEYDELKPGDRVSFDFETSGTAYNVERIGRAPVGR